VSVLEAESETILVGRPSVQALTDDLLPRAGRASPGWLAYFAATGAGTLLLLYAVVYTIVTGIGVWGNNMPIAWAFDITNFVWWIGIGHAGTFISAFLLLLEQRWRTSINRIAEAMTLFAVMQAALFPLLHLGRPWFFYWLIPFPTTTKVWPNFKSALPWDAAAVTTYFTVSLLFWYLGLLPDLATARDRATGRVRGALYGFFALGWRGSAHHWRHYRAAYYLLAGLATPLVISVHTIVSLDFATGVLAGWHSTIFPPYFVTGALLSGFAMVLTLVIPVRKILHLEHVITPKHLDNLAKIVLTTGWIVGFAYLMEFFLAWYGGNLYESWIFFHGRPFGTYAPVFWMMMSCNVIVPQIFWSRAARRSIPTLFVGSLLVNVGMWSERFNIVVSSLAQDFLPSSWGFYAPTWVDWSILFGTVSFFLFLFGLFLRYVPAVPVSELKEMAIEMEHERAHAREEAAP
jgi:molybdopterin-containing oxidoreductase family membrane subunit